MISGTVGYLFDGSVIHRIYATDLREIGMIVLRMARATRCRAGLSSHLEVDSGGDQDGSRA